MSSSSAASPYFQNSQYYQHNPQYNPQYNPQFYTPMVNVPTMNRLPSHGELAASVDLLIAHITKITTRLDRIESRVNDWVNLELAERMINAEKRMDTLTMHQNENGTKIASTNIELDYVFDSIKYANERIIDNENAVDRITDIIAKHETKLRHAKQRSRDNSKKCAEIGVLRGGTTPTHLCTFDYLGESIRSATLNNITALQQAWEAYRGDSGRYYEAGEVVTGCYRRTPIDD